MLRNRPQRAYVRIQTDFRQRDLSGRRSGGRIRERGTVPQGLSGKGSGRQILHKGIRPEDLRGWASQTASAPTPGSWILGICMSIFPRWSAWADGLAFPFSVSGESFSVRMKVGRANWTQPQLEGILQAAVQLSFPEAGVDYRLSPKQQVRRACEGASSSCGMRVASGAWHAATLLAGMVSRTLCKLTVVSRQTYAHIEPALITARVEGACSE